jgi:hypothetical protein
MRSWFWEALKNTAVAEESFVRWNDRKSVGGSVVKESHDSTIKSCYNQCFHSGLQ